MHPVVSAVLIMAFSIAIIGMVVSFGVPLLESKKQSLDFASGETAINHIAEVVSDLADDPVSSSKYADVEFASGRLEFEGSAVSFFMSSSEYSKTFDGSEFNKLDVYPGKSRLKMTKISVHEIHIDIE
jgi:hypothetical protein